MQKFATEMCARAHFCYKMVHCGIWDRCIVEILQQVYWPGHNEHGPSTALVSNIAVRKFARTPLNCIRGGPDKWIMHYNWSSYHVQAPGRPLLEGLVGCFITLCEFDFFSRGFKFVHRVFMVTYLNGTSGFCVTSSSGKFLFLSCADDAIFFVLSAKNVQEQINKSYMNCWNMRLRLNTKNILFRIHEKRKYYLR